MRGGAGCDCFRGARDDDLAAGIATVGTEVNQPVAGAYDIQVVFDHHHGIAGLHQTVQDAKQLLHVGYMQAGGRFVEDVHRPAGRTTRQFGGKFQALRLASGKGRRRLAKAYVAKPDIHKRLQLVAQRGNAGEELEAFGDGQFQDVGDGLALEQDSRASRL